MGFEPTTLGTTIRCSNQLSHSHHKDAFPFGMRRKDIPVFTLAKSAPENYSSLPNTAFLPAKSVFRISEMIVIGPTPPGTGVI